MGSKDRVKWSENGNHTIKVDIWTDELMERFTNVEKQDNYASCLLIGDPVQVELLIEKETNEIEIRGKEKIHKK